MHGAPLLKPVQPEATLVPELSWRAPQAPRDLVFKPEQNAFTKRTKTRQFFGARARLLFHPDTFRETFGRGGGLYLRTLPRQICHRRRAGNQPNTLACDGRIARSVRHGRTSAVHLTSRQALPAASWRAKQARARAYALDSAPADNGRSSSASAGHDARGCGRNAGTSA